jgi:Tol biopolymer transport system component
MELVEGDDLSQRVAKGAIPIDEALAIARQIADALEAAHEQGIIHRDLKPANIKVRPDGAVKVLDFGLAKAFDPSPSATDVSQLPTITSPAMTRMGVIMGTAAYMSPEQARGKAVDRRADIWAFGCVLFEMLTGKRAFEGDEVSDVLAAVLRQDVDLTALPVATPPRLRRLLARCLDRDPRMRLRDIGESRVEIDKIIMGAADEAVASPTTASVAAPRWRRVLPWAVAGALGLGMALVFLLWAPWRPLPAAAVPLRLSAELGADASLVIATGAAAPAGNAAVVSPDGSQLAFVAQPHGGGAPRLYVRRLDQLTATPLAGTEGAGGPFFSPDGQWLGFFGGGRLKKIAVTGGAPVTLADAPSARGGSWAEDGTIIFTPNSGNGSLWRVPAAGGTAERLTTPAPGEATHRWPQVLPGGRAVLYTVSATTGGGAYTNVWLAVQPLPTGTPHVVQRGGLYGRYLPSGLGSPKRAEREGGHLTWVLDGTLFAAPFDLATLAVTGPAVPVVPGVVSTSGGAQVDVSHTGTLVYLPGGDNRDAAAPLDWLTRDGKTMPLRATPATWSGVQIAPDGRRLAFALTDAANIDVWTYDVARDALTRLTFDPGADRNPVWTPDGRGLVYASARGGGAQNLYWQRADGSGDATRLTTSPNTQYPGSWHPSGRFLAFQETRPQTGNDLLILPVEGDEASGWKPGTPTVFMGGPFAEQNPRFSPDGRWLAYESTESGGSEIYVRPFPGPGGKWEISTGGGTNAVWSRARRELLYRAPDGRIMVVPYTAAGDALQAEKPRVWSETPVQLRPPGGASFDLHPDGERVAMAPGTEAPAGPTHVTLIFNFFDELRRLAPLGK